MAASGGRRSGNENVASGEISHKEKKQGVARDVEIEIDQTVHEEADATDKTRKMESEGEGLVLQEHTTERTKKQSAEKPGAARNTDDSGFGQSFEVIIVCVIDNFGVVQGFVRWENSLQSAETGAGPRMFAEDVPGDRQQTSARAAPCPGREEPGRSE